MTERRLLRSPVIKCLPREIMNGKDGMKFWCPFCKTWHLHGRGNGSRVPHCNFVEASSSPFLVDGYIIKMMSKAELREIRKEIDEYLREHQT